MTRLSYAEVTLTGDVPPRRRFTGRAAYGPASDYAQRRARRLALGHAVCQWISANGVAERPTYVSTNYYVVDGQERIVSGQGGASGPIDISWANEQVDAMLAAAGVALGCKWNS